MRSPVSSSTSGSRTAFVLQTHLLPLRETLDVV
jgi:hypothetical protein